MKALDILKLFAKQAVAVIMAIALLVPAGIWLAGYTQDRQESAYALSKMGSTGSEVKKIQQKLAELGFYKGSIDSIYGSQTKQAVTAFQKSVGITADGIAGSQTLLYLGLSGGGSSGGNSQYSNADIELLAKVISAEARGESYEGQVAVGAVVLNRVKHPSFPDSISGVVYQNGAFSCVYDSNWSQPVAESAKRAARDAVNGWDPTGGAIYYYNPNKTNDRFMHSRQVIRVIGSHRFCI